MTTREVVLGAALGVVTIVLIAMGACNVFLWLALVESHGQVMKEREKHIASLERHKEYAEKHGRSLELMRKKIRD